MRPISILTCALLGAGLGLGPEAAAPALAEVDGQLDGTFYGDGKFSLVPTSGEQSIKAVVLAPDGRLVVAGYRTTANGQSTLFWAALDGTTAPTICSPATIASGLFGTANAASFDAQGGLILAGTADYAGSGEEGIALRYLYPACDLDEAWNGDGVFRTNNAANTRFTGLGFDAQHRPVLGGYFSDNSAIVVVRLTTAGEYDLAFDGDGQLEQDLGGEVDIRALLVQPNSRILVAGLISHPSESYNFVVARIDIFGNLDPTFSADGIAQVDFDGGQNDSARDLALDPVSGAILVAGSSRHDGTVTLAAVARLTAAGVLDSSWSGDGRWTGGLYDSTHLAAIERQSDGRILVAGQASDAGDDANFFIYGFTPAGEIDNSFGFLGASAVAFDLGGPLNDVTNATVLAAGKLVIAGFADTAGTDVGVVARLWIGLIFADDFERGSAAGWSTQLP